MTMTLAAGLGENVANLLVSSLANLAGHIGVVYQPGQEARFLTSLYQEGLGEGELTALHRLLQGRAIKLHEYQGVARRLNCLAVDALRRRVTAAQERLSLSHDRSMQALRERDLLDCFVSHVIALQPLMCTVDYLPAGGYYDVALEFLNFVENEEHTDLIDLARSYVMASVALGNERALYEVARSGRGR